MRKGARAFESYTRESDLESSCRDYCLRYGYQLTKLTAAIGDTDRMLTGPRIAPAVVFIELKTTEGRMTPKQRQNRIRLLSMGYAHIIIDRLADFKDLIRELNQFGVQALLD